VETKNQGGGLTDGPFNLVVDCGLPGWSYAVVGYNANLVRSTPGTTLTSLGTGRYDVTFPANISQCAYLATVGDPGNGLVFNPNGIYTGSGANASTVYIETKNPGGGLSAGIPFHLAVICPAAASTKIAVVNATGLITRGSALTSSFSPATGQYTPVTSRALTACATVARPTPRYRSTRPPWRSSRARPATPPTFRSAACCSSAAARPANHSTPRWSADGHAFSWRPVPRTRGRGASPCASPLPAGLAWYEVEAGGGGRVRLT
jgi:hypothetical protein